MATKQGLGRSVRLFRAFLVEQTEPEVFYGALAQDSAELLADHANLAGLTVLDVGAGPDEFAEEFERRGATYIPVDLDAGAPALTHGGVAADAGALPFADGSVDVVFSSNLIEHVRQPTQVANELVRVARPGGLIFIAYTNWLSPWGGHETSPWHWLGGAYARKRYVRKHGHLPKNRIDQNLFRVSAAWGVNWATKEAAADVLAVRPRYLPKWTTFLVRIPILREFLTWNLMMILRKR